MVHLNTNDKQGGAARAAYRLHVGLLGEGVNSRMVVMHKSGEDNEVQQVAVTQNDGNRTQETLLKVLVQGEYLNNRRSDISNTFFSLGYPGFDLSAIDLIKDSDILNLHWVVGLQSPSTLKRLFALQKPMVWTLHDQWPFTGGCHFSAGCERFTEDCAPCPMLVNDELNLPAALLHDKKESFRGSNVTLVSPSRWLASLADKNTVFDQFKVEVIPYSVDTDLFSPLPKLEAKSTLGIHSDTMCLLAVAENPNEKRKGFDSLRQSISFCASDERFRRLIQSNRMMLLVAGGIPENLDQLGVPVTALGYLGTDEKLRTAYCASDIFLLPSTEDNLPNTLLEAMSCGIPTVAFNVGGIPDVVKDGINGLLVNAGDWWAMARAILDLVFDSSRLEMLSHRARQTILKGYALPVQARRYASMYENILSAGKRSRKYPLNQKTITNAQSHGSTAMSNSQVVTLPLDTETGLALAAVVKQVAVAGLLSRTDDETKSRWPEEPIDDEVTMDTLEPCRPNEEHSGATSLRLNMFADYTYSKRSHFGSLRRPAVHAHADSELSNLKVYQDLLIYTFLLDNLKPGARVLEIGGGDSRIISTLRNHFEFWNLDKLEGKGNGPVGIQDYSGFHLVRDYIGEFNPALPDAYFDCVCSISVFEHVTEDEKLFNRICQDIDRVLKPGGISVHCFDVVWKKDDVWTNRFLDHLYGSVQVLNPRIPWPNVIADPDLFVMSKKAYDLYWKATTGKAYEDFGKPFSYNVLWKKAGNPAANQSEDAAVLEATVKTKRKGDVLPRITIVTPSFNQGQFLEECIDSVLSQDYPNLEYIIMDGGSTDNSIEVIKKFEKHISYWQSKPDDGQYDAINNGFKKCTGEVMAWLNSDDKYHPNALSKVAYVFSTYGSVDWITGRPTAWDTDGNLAFVESRLEEWTREKLLQREFRGSFIQQESTFWRRSLWQKVGATLQTELKLAADMELWLRFSRYAHLTSVDALLGGYRYQKDQRARVLKQEYLSEVRTLLARERAVEEENQGKSLRGSIVSIPSQAFDNIMHAREGRSLARSTERSLTDLAVRQLDELRRKEDELTLLKASLDERLAAIEAASVSLRDKEDEIRITQKAAMERARALVEKEEMIRSLHSVAEDRSRVLELVNEELERIKRHWAYRTAVRMKRLLEKISGRRSP